MASSVLSFVLLGNSASAERALQRVGAEAETTATRAERASARMHNSFVNTFNKVGQLATVAMVGIGVEAVRAASKFESAMTMVHTQAGASNAEVAKLGKQILDLAPKVGVGPEALATSLYHVESAGFRGAKAMDMVAAAAKLSMIGNTDIETASQAIIATMASGIKGVRDANDATALLNTTVGIGDMRMQDLATSLGSGILPVARQLGLSFEDVASAAATMTDNATKPQEVMTRLKTAMQTLIKPTPQQIAAFQQIGMSGLQVAEDFQKPNGLLVAVQDLKSHLDKVYPASQTAKLSLGQIQAASKAYYDTLVTSGTNAKDATKLTAEYTKKISEGGSATVLAANNIVRALGGSKTAGVFLTLIGQSGRLTDKFHQFGDAASRARKLAEAWAKQQETAKQKLADVKAAWDVFLVRIGNAILPTLKKVLDVLAKHPGIIEGVIVAIGLLSTAWIGMKIGGLISMLSTLAGKILAVGAASTTAAAETEAAGLGTAVAKVGTAGVAGGAGTTAAGVGGGVLAAAAVAPAVALGFAFGMKKLFPDQGFTDEQLKAWGLDADTLKQKLAKQQPKLAYAITAVQKTLGTTAGNQFALAVANGVSITDAWSTIADQFHGDPKMFAANGTLNGEAYGKAQTDAVNKYLTSQAKAVQKYLKALYDAQTFWPNALSSGFGGDSAKAGQDAGFMSKTGAAGARQKESAETGILTAAQVKAAAVQKYLTALKTAASKENANYATSLAVLNDKLTLNAGLLSTGAVAGVDNSKAIRGAVVATDEHALAVYRQTGNLGQARKAFHDGIQTIEDNMVALGYNRDTADQLVQQLLGIKNNSHLDIEVTANGSFNLKDLFASGAIGGAAGGAAAAFAAGGHVRGPGSGTSDSIPAYLSAGEYVMPAHVVKQMGVGFFDGLRAKRFASGGLASFDAQFPPTMNRHVESLETAMNGMAQKWFASRQRADMSSFAASQSVGDTSGGSAAAKAYAMARLAQLGQLNQWPALLQLWTAESGWNPNAVNPIGAMGIPQAYGHGNVFALGDWRAQVDWGLNYIESVYGGPAAAWAQWHKADGSGSYANGGITRKGWGLVGERGPELVQFGGGERVYTNAQSRAMAGGGGVTIVIQAWDGKSVDQWLQRGGAVQIKAALDRRNNRG